MSDLSLPSGIQTPLYSKSVNPWTGALLAGIRFDQQAFSYNDDGTLHTMVLSLEGSPVGTVTYSYSNSVLVGAALTGAVYQ